ncbi:MAG TPA: HD-GYP domain-containing protein [Dehalococcoidia bacterium]|nr:HD-GYP domain-containing protein [Dehalococcoidia bacterium]
MVMSPMPARGFHRRTALALLVALVPGAVLLWLLQHPGQNPAVVVPTQHFLIVSTVSLVALGVAALVTIAALQIEQYRVLLLGLGFMSMAGLFAVHALSTPGIFGNAAPAHVQAGDVLPSYGAFGSGSGGDDGYAAPASADYDDGSYGYVAHAGMDHRSAVVGLSAFLSLLVPAIFFALSFSPLATPLDWRVPFRPAALAIVVGVGLACYGVLALGRASLFDGNPLLREPWSSVITWSSGVLLLSCAVWQYRTYQRTRLPLQGGLIVAFLWLALADVSMVKAPMWTLAWWEYHVLMLGAVCVALGTLLHEYRRGQPVRRVLEGALELRVEVGVELEQVEAIAMLAAATEAKDPDTKGHTVRVAEVAVAIGRELGLPYLTLRTLARAGLLHDVGKILIPDAVLLKPGPLDDAEWTVMKQHPQLGLEILEGLGTLQREAEILLAHHEQWNGGGYPRGLTGEQIPLEARIIAVADTFDAIVSDRPYRKGLPRERAVEIIERESGNHLYPPAVNAFLRIIKNGRLGELVDGIYRRTERAA